MLTSLQEINTGTYVHLSLQAICKLYHFCTVPDLIFTKSMTTLVNAICVSKEDELLEARWVTCIHKIK